MMTLRFSCPKCSTNIAVPDEYGGKKGECPKCGAKIIVPHTSSRPDVQGKVTCTAGTQDHASPPHANPALQPSALGPGTYRPVR